MSKRRKRFLLGVAMMGAGVQANRVRREREDRVLYAATQMRAQWEADNANVPVHDRRPDLANFDPLIERHPTEACGLAIGDSVEIVLFSFQGKGVVTAISTDYEESHGTKLYPMFYVRIDANLGEWFGRKALTRA